MFVSLGDPRESPVSPWLQQNLATLPGPVLRCHLQPMRLEGGSEVTDPALPTWACPDLSLRILIPLLLAGEAAWTPPSRLGPQSQIFHLLSGLASLGSRGHRSASLSRGHAGGQTRPSLLSSVCSIGCIEQFHVAGTEYTCQGANKHSQGQGLSLSSYQTSSHQTSLSLG